MTTLLMIFGIIYLVASVIYGVETALDWNKVDADLRSVYYGNIGHYVDYPDGYETIGISHLIFFPSILIIKIMRH